MKPNVEGFKMRLESVGDSAIKYIKYFDIDYDELQETYNSLGLKCPIMLKKSPGYISNRGWGNGYVHIPEGHKYYGLHYDEIPYDVHGGLTFSEVIKDSDLHNWPKGHWIGFDTAHYGDNKHKWGKNDVFKETIDLFLQTVE